MEKFPSVIHAHMASPRGEYREASSGSPGAPSRTSSRSLRRRKLRSRRRRTSSTTRSSSCLQGFATRRTSGVMKPFLVDEFGLAPTRRSKVLFSALKPAFSMCIAARSRPATLHRVLPIRAAAVMIVASAAKADALKLLRLGYLLVELLSPSASIRRSCGIVPIPAIQKLLAKNKASPVERHRPLRGERGVREPMRPRAADARFAVREAQRESAARSPSATCSDARARSRLPRRISSTSLPPRRPSHGAVSMWHRRR